MNIGKALKTCRKAKNYTQDKLAEKSGITKSYLSLIENNKREVSFSLIEKLAKSLKIPTHLLIFLSLEKKEAQDLPGNVTNELNKLILDILHESSN